MGDVVQDALEQLRAGTVPEEDMNPDAVSAEAATPDVPETETPAPRPRYKLSEVDLDDPDLPPSLRGQPASVLFDERRRAITEVQNLANERNSLKTERDMALRTLEVLAERFGSTPPAPAATVTTLDRIRQSGVDTSALLSDQSEAALVRLVEAAAEETDARLSPAIAAKINELNQKLSNIEHERASERETKEHDSYRSAWQSARPDYISEADWNENAGHASAYVLANKLPLNDRASYTAWVQWCQTGAQKIARPAQTATTSTPAPTAPAPPVGGGRPAAPVQTGKASSRLNNHQRESAAKIVNIFKAKVPSLDMDSVMEDVISDPKTKRTFFP